METETDKGTEFLNSTFQQMLRRHSVHFYTSKNEDDKASVVQRFTRTLKTMYRYFTFKNNATHHRSIGKVPNEVNADNEALVPARLYRPKWATKNSAGATTLSAQRAHHLQNHRVRKGNRLVGVYDDLAITLGFEANRHYVNGLRRDIMAEKPLHVSAKINVFVYCDL